jgi:hypothetical protein
VNKINVGEEVKPMEKKIESEEKDRKDAADVLSDEELDTIAGGTNCGLPPAPAPGKTTLEPFGACHSY